jgi:hypothetical protein
VEHADAVAAEVLAVEMTEAQVQPTWQVSSELGLAFALDKAQPAGAQPGGDGYEGDSPSS